MTIVHVDMIDNKKFQAESVSYINDMLVSLQKLAVVEQQSLLAHLLALAAEEARLLKNAYNSAEKDHNRDTLPPG